MTTFAKNKRNKVRRVAKRGVYDKETIYQIVDEALICHVGFVEGNQPFVIPTIHARVGDSLVFHGARASRLMKHIQAGFELCVAITFLDGLVMARSIFHHSMNYRSVLLFGRGQLIDDKNEKLAALEALTDHIMPGRWQDARQPTKKELKATSVVSMAIESASAKIRTGPPGDDEEDYDLPVWAGVLPIRQQWLAPIPDPRLADNTPLPDYLHNHHRK